MKILIASDLHGDKAYTKALVDLFHRENFDKLYLLGDLLEDSIRILNPIADKILSVRGNCDSEKDIEEALFPMPYLNLDYAFGKVIILSHGHYESPYTYDKPYDIFFFGHSHCNTLMKDYQGHILANPGSFAHPRDGLYSYMVMDESGIRAYDYNSGGLIHSLTF